ncbi:hypothetical protein POTOM_054079 [Populus tomentosa]|uniref:Protein kinase domain-containing protein n=1 Tax=Populus tomentosa TaxID=118781 RepID=A0A8X7Y6X4_POPTO|nr:hypothetical protein POTOM_054079 [Populus tomentosa]
MNLNGQHRRQIVNSFIEDEIAGTNPCLQGSGEDENKKKGGCNDTIQIDVPFQLQLTEKERVKKPIDIKKTNNSFNNRLDQGGFDGVYEGKLLDGRLLAVKVLTMEKNLLMELQALVELPI